MKEYKKTDWENYRQLKKGEIVKAGDEFLEDNKGWTEVIHSIGRSVPDPLMMAHTMYRRTKQEALA